MDNYSTNYETENSIHTYNGTLYSRTYNRQDTVFSNETNVVNDQAQSVNTVSAEYNSSQQDGYSFQLNDEIGKYNAVDLDNTNQKESIGQKNDFNIPPDNEQSVGLINKTQLAQQNSYSQLHKCNLMREVNISQLQSLKKQNSSGSLESSK